MKSIFFKYILLSTGALILLSFKMPSGDKFSTHQKRGQNAGDSLKPSKEQLQKYCGDYLPTGTDPRMAAMSVVLYGDVLYRHVNNNYAALNPSATHKFIYDDNSGRGLEFVTTKDGVVTEVIVSRPDGQFILKKDQTASANATATLAKGVTERIAQLMEKYVDYGQFNGSVLVSQNGKIIYKKGFGMANMESSVPNEPDTKYRLASVSKQFTAMLILQLVEQGKLSLQTPIKAYLPDYPKVQGQKITLHHLLTHSSGIPNFTSLPDYRSKMMRKQYSPEELVQVFANLPLAFEPGQRFEYSNSGYALLGYIIEKVTGKSYEQCLQDQIFIPLKMNNSGYDHTETILQKRAMGYDKMGNTFVNTAYLDMSVPFAAGALYSTVEDLYLWDQALYTDVLLPAKAKALMFTNYYDGKPGGYGYGWGIHPIMSLRTGQTYTITEHSGGINGFNTIISRVPADKHLVVLLSNTGNAQLHEINYAIRAILYNQPYDMPKMSLAYTLANMTKTQGLTNGFSKLAELKSSGLYAIKEDEVNDTGYEFLNSGKLAEAIEFFKLNVETFPGSANCYDSLGEAYLKQGNKQLAIKNYKMSIELDPKNENGKKVLAGLLK